MATIKTTNVEPRTNNGTLTIGTDDSATYFKGQVVLPEHATKAELDEEFQILLARIEALENA